MIRTKRGIVTLGISVLLIALLPAYLSVYLFDQTDLNDVTVPQSNGEIFFVRLTEGVSLEDGVAVHPSIISGEH